MATIKMVNEIGFVASSVSKIAKEAQVSPATLYVYFKNKDDLLVSTCLTIKRDMSSTVLEGLDDSRPIRDILGAFIFYPVMILANPNLCNGFELSEENVDTAFQLA